MNWLATHGLPIAFWCCIGGIVYAYAGYPVIMYLLSRAFGHEPTPPPERTPLPSIAVLIAAHNEAEVLDERIRNALALEYPRDQLEIIIASDGSDDATAAICARYQSAIRFLDFPARRGKAATLNAAVELIEADIIALSDANTHMDPASLRHLASWFADESVGAVCGRLILTDPATGKNTDSAYWRYESFLKGCEGRLSGLLGANGALYAIRRHLFTPLRPGTIVDDFVIPLAAKLQTGCRIVYDTRAIAREVTAASLRSEFARRVRIGIGGWQAMHQLWPLVHPRHGWTAFTFCSHKILRWVCPFLMLGALATSAAMIERPLYQAALMVQAAFYGIGIGAAIAPPLESLRRMRLCSMFASMNLALLIGFLRWVRGNSSGVWRRTPRANESNPA